MHFYLTVVCPTRDHSGLVARSSLPPSPPGPASARARAPLAAEVVATKLGPLWARECGARGGAGRQAAGRGRAQEAEAGADQRGRAERAGPTVKGPLTSSFFPLPDRPLCSPSLPSLFPHVGI